MPLLMLHSQSPILYNLAGALTLFPLTLGLIGVFSPSTTLKLYNFQQLSKSRDAQNLILFHSSRDLFMAAVNFAAWWKGDREMLGRIMFAGCGVAIFDGWISRRVIGKDAWKHAGWVPIIGTMGAALLGAFD